MKKELKTVIGEHELTLTKIDRKTWKYERLYKGVLFERDKGSYRSMRGLYNANLYYVKEFFDLWITITIY